MMLSCNFLRFPLASHEFDLKKKKSDRKIGWLGLDYSELGLLRLVLACPGPVRMYLAEMPHLQDSLNQTLKIPKFLATEHMNVKRISIFMFSSFLPPAKFHHFSL